MNGYVLDPERGCYAKILTLGGESSNHMCYYRTSKHI